MEAEEISKEEESAKKGGKRKRQSSPNSITKYLSTGKKRKVEVYELSKEVEKHVALDSDNEKLWLECKEAVREGKQKFLSKVEEIFLCVCCQEVVYEPLTLPCKHNVCKVNQTHCIFLILFCFCFPRVV